MTHTRTPITTDTHTPIIIHIHTITVVITITSAIITPLTVILIINTVIGGEGKIGGQVLLFDILISRDERRCSQT